MDYSCRIFGSTSYFQRDVKSERERERKGVRGRERERKKERKIEDKMELHFPWSARL